MNHSRRGVLTRPAPSRIFKPWVGSGTNVARREAGSARSQAGRRCIWSSRSPFWAAKDGAAHGGAGGVDAHVALLTPPIDRGRSRAW